MIIGTVLSMVTENDGAVPVFPAESVAVTITVSAISSKPGDGDRSTHGLRTGVAPLIL